MNLNILLSIVTLSGVAIGLGIFLTEFLKSDEGKFDERQLIEQGRGANLSMNIGISYLLGLFVGCSFDLIQPAYLPVVAVYGLTVMMIVYHGYCIFHDDYLNREQEWRKEVLRKLRLGGIWVAIAFFTSKQGDDDAWIDGAIALSWLSEGMMILLRELVLRIRDRRAAKDECDG